MDSIYILKLKMITKKQCTPLLCLVRPDITYRARELKARAEESINHFNLYKQSKALTLWTDLWKTLLLLKASNFIL